MVTFCTYCPQQLMPTWLLWLVWFSVIFLSSWLQIYFCKVILPLSAPHCQGFCCTISRWQKWVRTIKPTLFPSESHLNATKFCSSPSVSKDRRVRKKNLCARNTSSCLILKPIRNNQLKEDHKCKYILWIFIYCPSDDICLTVCALWRERTDWSLRRQWL